MTHINNTESDPRIIQGDPRPHIPPLVIASSAMTYTPNESWLFWLQEKSKDPQFESHGGIKVVQVLGSPLYICATNRKFIFVLPSPFGGILKEGHDPQFGNGWAAAIEIHLWKIKKNKSFTVGMLSWADWRMRKIHSLWLIEPALYTQGQCVSRKSKLGGDTFQCIQRCPSPFPSDWARLLNIMLLWGVVSLPNNKPVTFTA